MKRERRKSSGNSLQVERGDKRKKKDTGNNKCQMREMAAGPEKEKKERKKEKEKQNYTTDRIARLRECVLNEINTKEERKTESGKDTRCVK